MDPNELAQILNNEAPGPSASVNNKEPDFKSEVLSTDPKPSVQTPPLERYVYEVKLPNGKVIRVQDKDELDKFVQDNKDLGFDFQF